MILEPLLEPGWLSAILPELVLIAGGILLIMLEAFTPRLRGIFASLAIIVLIAAAFSEFVVAGGVYFGGTYELSPITRIFDLTFMLAALLAVMFARDYLRREGSRLASSTPCCSGGQSE
jgi:NADH:ubiquinone oxidoreductase subunit 2 (subunit N)